MDELERNFQILAAECDSEESPELYNALLSIKEVIDSPDYNSKSPRFREFLGNYITDYLIRALSSSNNKTIVNIIVYILGHVSNFLNELHNVLDILSLKLSMLTLEDDNIIESIYRLLGNLCQEQGLWNMNIVNKRPMIVEHIVCTLKAVARGTSNVTSKATIIMAIRCIGALLNPLTLIKLVTKFEVLKPLGLILIKFNKTWNQNHEHENILYNVIKVLYEYSKFDCHHLITDLKNTEQGNSLLCLSDVLLISPENIVKIIMNVLRISELQSELPIPEICQGLMEYLPNGRFMVEDEYEEYIQCICYLFEHPATRNSICCSKNIPLLINTLKQFREASDSNLRCSFLIMSTLNKCKYNKELIDKQLDNGIIEVLTEKLEWFFDPPESFNMEHTFQISMQNIDALTSDINTEIPPLNIVKGKYSSKLMKIGPKRWKLEVPCKAIPVSIRDSDSSSESEISIIWRSKPDISSMCSGEPVISNMWTELELDDNSSVCSDSDLDVDSNDELMKTDLKSPKVEAEFVLSKRESQLSKFVDEIILVIRNYLNLVLVNHLTYTTAHKSLVSANLLIALSKCYYFKGSDELLNVILEILNTSSYLIPLMLTDFEPRFSELMKCHHTSACYRCNQLRAVRKDILRSLIDNAQSDFGVRTIAFQLLHANEDVKVKLSLLIPYIIKTKSLLLKLMIYCGALEILLKICQNGELKSRGINAFCQINGKVLGIVNPKKVCHKPVRRIVIDIDNYRLRKRLSDVTFKLDDGSSVLADRELLSLKSDYFSALLNSSFRESEEDEIRLTDIGNRTLKSLLYLMNHHWDISVTETLETNLDLETILDVTRQCDKFLLNNLCVVLTNSIKQLILSPETVSKIYQWSIESSTNFLREESVTFALAADIPNEERFRMFSNLFSLRCSEVFVDDIQNLLDSYLKSKDRRIHEYKKIWFY